MPPINTNYFLMNVKAVKTKKDYKEALKRRETIALAKRGTPEKTELEVLDILISKYTITNFPEGLPDPVEAIKLRVDELGYTQTDLVTLVGQKTKVSEILNRKRKLSLDMIRLLHKELNIPAAILIQEY